MYSCTDYIDKVISLEERYELIYLLGGCFFQEPRKERNMVTIHIQDARMQIDDLLLWDADDHAIVLPSATSSTTSATTDIIHLALQMYLFEHNKNKVIDSSNRGSTLRPISYILTSPVAGSPKQDFVLRLNATEALPIIEKYMLAARE